ncbi:MAG: glycosyltransferase [Myxococcales bacterium]|nr:glycosyltransferase [Myxococcales bacterium]
MQTPLRVIDINNFFSSTGGGVRRYHLEKLQALSEDPSLEYHVVVPSDREEVERYGRATIHHLPAANALGTGYRYLINPVRLRKLFLRLQPDVIEVGSPYVLPDLVRWSARGLNASVVGFWHAHYPVAYAGRPLSKRAPALGKAAERLAWWWAERTYGRFDSTLVAANCVREALQERGVKEVTYTPLGVDLQLFTPTRRSATLRESWGAKSDDVVMAFPHRLCEEKNLSAFVDAYERLRSMTSQRAILVFAGRGPEVELVNDLVERYPEDVHYLGYLPGREAMAELLASVDIVAALSPTETFGLSAAEAMAAGNALVGSEDLSIGEMLTDSRAGFTVRDGDSEAIAEAWMELLRPGRARLLGARAHTFAQRNFSWDRTFERILTAYSAAAGRSRDQRTKAPRVGSWGAGIARILADDSRKSAPELRRTGQRGGFGRRSA